MCESWNLQLQTRGACPKSTFVHKCGEIRDIASGGSISTCVCFKTTTEGSTRQPASHRANLSQRRRARYMERSPRIGENLQNPRSPSPTRGIFVAKPKSPIIGDSSVLTSNMFTYTTLIFTVRRACWWAMRSSYPEVLGLAVKRFIGVGMVVGMVLIRPNSSLLAPLQFDLSSRRHHHAPAASTHQPNQHKRLRSLSTRDTRRNRRRAGQTAAGAMVVSVESGKDGHALQSGLLPEDHLLKAAFKTLEDVLARYSSRLYITLLLMYRRMLTVKRGSLVW